MQSNAGNNLIVGTSNLEDQNFKKLRKIKLYLRHGIDSFSKTDPWNMERAQVGFHFAALFSAFA